VTTTNPGEYVTSPLTTPLAIFTPLPRLVFTSDTAYVTRHTNIEIFFHHLQDLREMQVSLQNKVTALNITHVNFPTYKIINENLDTLLTETSENLLTSIQSLTMAKQCQQQFRSKRDLIREEGVLPGVGRALSWLTGTLTSDATKFINANTHNIQKLQTAQIATIQVLNNTEHAARSNAIRIQNLRRRFTDMGNRLNKEITVTQSVDLITSLYMNLIMAIQNFQVKVDHMTTQWQAASEGKFTSQHLKGRFYKYLLQHLDSDTLAHLNKKFLIKRLATISIESCHSHVWQHISIPLIGKKSLPLYRIHHTPVQHGSFFDVLTNQAHAVSWSDESVYEFTKEEFDDITALKKISIAKAPTFKAKLTDSCLYALANQLEHKCKMKHVQHIKPFVTFEQNFLTYSVNSLKTIAVVTCPHATPIPRQLLGAGTILLPYRCRIKLNNVIFENTSPDHEKAFDMEPLFFKLDKMSQTIVTNSSWIHEQYVDDSSNFDKDMAMLQGASNTLASFDIPHEYVFAGHLTMATITLILVILVIILFLIVCGPLRKLGQPPIQVVQMRTMSRDQL